MAIQNKLFFSLFVLSLLSTTASCFSQNIDTANTNPIQRIDIAAIPYDLSAPTAIYPAQLFTRKDAALISFSSRNRSSDEIADISFFEKKLPPSNPYPGDFFINHPIDARIACLITRADHSIDVLWFGGPYMVYNNKEYHIDYELLKSIANHLPDRERNSILESLHN